MTRKSGDWDYVQRKVEHLKRMGLVAHNSSGIGKNGGACPDWLAKLQRGDASAAAS